MTKQEIEHKMDLDGFVEISVEDSTINGAHASTGCSGGRSDCCTRVCSQDSTFAGSNQDWEAFLLLEGGEIQY